MFSKIRRLVMKQFTVCPRTGKITGLKIGTRKALWLWIVLGLASVIWVLIRVVPKPSRATYPCQKVAQPLAAGFIVWLLGLVGSSLIIQRARSLFQRQRYVVGVICFATAVLLSFLTLSDTPGVAASAGTFVPTDSANSPMGIAKGINPGRVVWVYDSLLCDQGSTSGWWWEDKRTDPEEAQRMMNQALLNLTGIDDPVKSWDSLFKYFNRTRYNQNDVGYQAGDKIAIKVNNIFSRFYEWTDSQDSRPCPQMLHALLWAVSKQWPAYRKRISPYMTASFITATRFTNTIIQIFPACAGLKVMPQIALTDMVMKTVPVAILVPGKRLCPIPTVWSIMAIRTLFQAAARSACPRLSQRPSISST